MIDLPPPGQRQASPRDATPPDPAALLQQAALALNSTLETREVLRRLAELALEASGADRASLFLLDDRRLQPTVSVGRAPDERLWAAFRRMPAPGPGDAPSAWVSLCAGEVVAIEDAADSHALPRAWVEQFSLAALVLVPLTAGDELTGMLAIDAAERRTFASDDLELLRAIGASAGVAIRNAQWYEAAKRRAAVQEALSRGAATLVSRGSVTELAETLTDTYTDLLRASMCGIALLDPAWSVITPLATRGTQPPGSPFPVSCLPTDATEPVRRAWTDDTPRSVTLPAAPWLQEVAGDLDEIVDEFLLLPLANEGRVRGVVLLGFGADDRPGQEARGAAQTLANLAAAALERAGLHEQVARQRRRAETLYQLSRGLGEPTDLGGLRARLNRHLRAHGVEVVDIGFRDRILARHLPGTPSVRSVTRLLRSGARDPADGSAIVPMTLAARTVGLLRVRPAGLDEATHGFLGAVGRLVAEAVDRARLRAEVLDAERRRAATDERARIAADLHDTVGQLFVAIAQSLRRVLAHLPPESSYFEDLRRVEQAASAGKWELDQAIRALAFVPASRRGLVASLRELGQAFEVDSGIDTLVDVTGQPTGLDGKAAEALYRVAHEALSNTWRHARAATVRVAVACGPDDVTLTVRDDGVGLRGDRRPGIGTVSMRRALAEVDGRLRIHNVAPRGVAVEATVPRATR